LLNSWQTKSEILNFKYSQHDLPFTSRKQLNFENIVVNYSAPNLCCFHV